MAEKTGFGTRRDVVDHGSLGVHAATSMFPPVSARLRIVNDQIRGRGREREAASNVGKESRTKSGGCVMGNREFAEWHSFCTFFPQI